MVNYPRLGAVNLAAVSVVHKEQTQMKEELTIAQREQNKLEKQFNDLKAQLNKRK